MENLQNSQPRPPYEQYCYETLTRLKGRQPYFTNEMLDLVWPETARLENWAHLSDAEKEGFRNKPRVDVVFPPLLDRNGHSLLPPLAYKSTRRDFKAVEIYIEEQFNLGGDGIAGNRRALRSQFHRNFADLPEVQKRRLKRKAHRRNIRKAAFLALSMGRPFTDLTTPDPNSRWIYIRPLGQGGYGRAYHMARLDENENVLENMAVKITDLSERPNRWAFQKGGPENMLREIAYHQASSAVEPDYVVEFKNYHVSEASRTYRIYMEYCPYGDLYHLMCEYRHLQTGIPEQFLWYVMKALTAACEAMTYNVVRAQGEIVHLDLNPNNVFLGFEDDELFPVYPTPKVADFGLAVETDPNDRRNPDQFAYMGTQGFHAPENDWRMWAGNRHVMRMALGTAKVYGYTNVYQCGLIMYSLMRLRMGYKAPPHEGYRPPSPPPLINIQQPPDPFSQDFLGTVYAYMITTPNQRPTPLTGSYLVQDAIDRLASDMSMYREEFGDLHGRYRHYAGKLIYDIDQEGLAFRPESQSD